MLRFKKSLLCAAALLPALSLAAFGQINVNVNLGGPAKKSSSGAAVATSSGGGGDAIAAYVFGTDNAANGEELSEAIVTNLSNSRRYSEPRRGAREFFREADKMQARNRGRLLDDRDFCRIGGDYGVQYLAIIDIEKAGRGNSVWARIINLDNCRLIATAEYTGLVRNNQEIRQAARSISDELLNGRIGKRSIGGGAAVSSSAQPAPPPPSRSRGDAIAGYVFGADNAKLGEDLADEIVKGLTNHRKYSAPRRGARGFFREVERREARSRNSLLSDKDFCRIGADYEVDYLVIIDIEKAGRGNSIWARILDLETCQVIATGESTALIRNDGEVNAVANDIVSQLVNRRVGQRSITISIGR